MKQIPRNILGISNLGKETVVVTGANGWLGKSAVSVLASEFSNYRVIALSRNIDHNKSNNDLQMFFSYK